MQFTKNKPSTASKLAEYQEQGVPQLVSVLEQKGADCLVLNAQNQEITIAQNRLYQLPGKVPPQFSHRNQITSYLRELAKESNKIKNSVNLDRAWEAFKNSQKEVGPEQIQRALFPNQNLANFLAVRWALLADKFYFKRGKNGFLPRPGESVESIKLTVAAEEERKAKIKLWSEKLNSGAELDAEAITLLEQVAANGKKYESWHEAEQLLTLTNPNQADKRIEDQAFNLLVKLGRFSVHQNLTPIKIGRSTSFTPEEIQAAKEIKPNVKEALNKNLDIFTIDGDETRDFDDALSIEINPDHSLQIGIHITDVSSYIRPGELLWQTSINRSATVYTADQNYPMLPHFISEELFSLIQDQPRAAISIFANLNQDFELIDYKIEKSTISVTSRLTYNQLDHDLINNQAPKELRLLLQVSEKLECERIKRGAKILPKREMFPVIDTNGIVRLEILNEETPARKLVGEMMILANFCMASYAHKNKIPFIYRTQEAPETKIDENLIPEGPAREYALRGAMKRSILSCSPRAHYGLALEYYGQCTSPIRRAIDLINQYQINQHLSPSQFLTTVLTTEQIEKLIPELETKMGEVTYLQRKRHRYWLLEYIDQSGLKELEGTVVKTDGPKPLVEVDNLFLISQYLPLKNKLPVIGSRIKLKLEQISAKLDRLKLNEYDA